MIRLWPITGVADLLEDVGDVQDCVPDRAHLPSDDWRPLTYARVQPVPATIPCSRVATRSS